MADAVGEELASRTRQNRRRKGRGNPGKRSRDKVGKVPGDQPWVTQAARALPIRETEMAARGPGIGAWASMSDEGGVMLAEDTQRSVPAPGETRLPAKRPWVEVVRDIVRSGGFDKAVVVTGSKTRASRAANLGAVGECTSLA